MLFHEDDEDEVDSKTPQSTQHRKSANEIINVIKSNSADENIDFTQNIMELASSMEKISIISGLLPGLQILATGPPELQKTLLDQFVPLLQLILQQYSHDVYTKAADTLMPLIEDFLYSQNSDVRDKAISIIHDLRGVVEESEKEKLLAITLRMAHDEDNEY